MNKTVNPVDAKNNNDIIARLRSIDGLDVDSCLKTLSNSIPIYLRILNSFLKMAEKDKGVMIGYIEQDDINSFKIAIHGYKGVLANIGALSLSDFSRELEKSAKDGDVEAIKTRFIEFDSQFYSFAAKIEGALKNHE